MTIIEEHATDLIAQITIMENKASELPEKIQTKKTSITQYKEIFRVYSQLENEYNNLQRILNSIEDKNSPLYRIIKEKLEQIKQLLDDLKDNLEKTEDAILDLKEEEEISIKIDIETELDMSKISTQEVLKLIKEGDKTYRQIIEIKESNKEQPRIVISQLAIDKMKEYGKSSNKEIGGILWGKYDSNTNTVTVYDFSSVPGGSNPTTFNITPEAWNVGMNEMDRFNATTNQDIEIMGWFHTHPNFGCFLSAFDTSIHVEHFKPKKNALAIVYDPIRDEFAIWYNNTNKENLSITPVTKIELIGDNIDSASTKKSMMNWKPEEYPTNEKSPSFVKTVEEISINEVEL